MLVSQTRKKAFSWIYVQTAVAVIVSLAWALHSWHAAYSAFLGSLASIIPTAIFAYRFFGKIQERSGQKIMTSFYIGEMFKLALSVILLLIMLRLQLQALPLFCGFIAAHLGLWFKPLKEATGARATSG